MDLRGRGVDERIVEFVGSETEYESVLRTRWGAKK
jgi:hypothetical protein